MRFKTGLFILTGLSLAAAVYSEPGHVDSKTRPMQIELQVVRVFDPLLPVLSDQDLQQVLQSSREVIEHKLGRDVTLSFVDAGKVDLDAFFHSVSYQEDRVFKMIKHWRHRPELADQDPLLHSSRFRKTAIAFLKHYKIEKLQGFFPDQPIHNYNQAFAALHQTYNKKIQWLKQRTNNRGQLVWRQKPGQSYVHWLGLMHAQKKYDIVITNSLIVFDLMSEPYPHSIAKHAKVGGSSFSSPARMALGGRSLLVNIIEEYGQIEGVSKQRSIKRSLRNQMLGGFLLAHEFGHAFYLLPDFYDHPADCLMNSAMENMDALAGYRLLLNNNQPCKQCYPWVKSKRLVLHAEQSLAGQNYLQAGRLFEAAIRGVPSRIDGSRRHYIQGLREKAIAAYLQAGHNAEALRLESEK
ncbi:MAG: hypothetical protein KDK39_10400 [Leptospiraceae bacterium]|nr:hypothetical protein [Leptospiraceae bacterium]